MIDILQAVCIFLWVTYPILTFLKVKKHEREIERTRLGRKLK